MPILAGIFTKMLLIIHVDSPKGLFVYILLLLFAVHLVEEEVPSKTDLCNEENKHIQNC